MELDENHKIRFGSFFPNFIATSTFILLASYFYYHNGAYHHFLTARPLTIIFIPGFERLNVQYIYLVTSLYILALIPFFWGHRDSVCKVRSIFKALISKNFSPPFGNNLRVLLLKLFYSPLMFFWVAGLFCDLSNRIYTLKILTSASTFYEAFNAHFFWLWYVFLDFVDVAFFAFGYAFESTKLKNKIISVDPTLTGWLVCIACYTPTNIVMRKTFGWKSVDYPQFSHAGLSLTLGILVLGLYTIYTWASVALGSKASNLTNRGIVEHGPYAWIRHPHYSFKNMAWWIGTLPLYWNAFQAGNLKEIGLITFSMSGWSLVYYFRSITEERHLLMANNGYAEYCKRVPYRFIPKII